MTESELLGILDEIGSSPSHEQLGIDRSTTTMAFGLHGHQHLALHCAKRGLVCMWHKATLQYLIFSRKNWEDISR
jgi:hypothetical protein